MGWRLLKKIEFSICLIFLAILCVVRTRKSFSEEDVTPPELVDLELTPTDINAKKVAKRDIR